MEYGGSYNLLTFLTEYEKITWCTTDVTFQRRSRECVRQFNAAVAGLDRRYGSIERYQIVTSPPAAVTDNWEESCRYEVKLIL